MLLGNVRTKPQRGYKLTGMPKTFVVDACLALDAGSISPPAERGARVRRFLIALKDASHVLGFTNDLEQEWKDHAARFARRWLATMRSKRKVVRLSPPPKPDLRDRALQTAATAKIQDAMEKDWHLLEAALSKDRTIASSDDKARSYYAEAATKVAALKPIVWVNPATNDLKNWVEEGAQDSADKRLG